MADGRHIKNHFSHNLAASRLPEFSEILHREAK